MRGNLAVKTIYACALFLFFTIAVMITAETAAAYQKDWLKPMIVPGAGREYGEAIAAGSNGEIYDVIALDAPEPGDATFLEKRDAGGAVLWTRFVGMNWGKVFLLPAPNGVRVAFSGQYPSPPDRYAIRVASFLEDGTTDWTVDYVPSEMTSDFESYIRDAAVNSDGRIAIALESSKPGSSDHAVAAVFDAQGNLEWEAAYLPDDTDFQTSEKIAWGEDGSLYITVVVFTETDIERRQYLVKYRPNHGLDWSRRLDDSAVDYLHVHDLLVDGDAVYAWMSCAWAEGINDFARLIRYNANGELIWQHAFATDFNDDESEALGMALLPGGDVVAALYRAADANAGEGYRLLRFDAHTGEIVWDAILDLSDFDTQYFDVSCVPGMDDNGMIWVQAHFTAPPRGGRNWDRLAMFRFLEDGTPLSPVVYDGPETVRADYGEHAVLYPGGGLVFNASRSPWGLDVDVTSADLQRDVLLARLSSDADTVWATEVSVPRPYTEVLELEALPTSNGGVVVGATVVTETGSDDIVVMHVEPDGSRAWQTIIANGEHDLDDLSGIYEDGSGGYYVTAIVTTEEREFPIIARIDSSGTELWRRVVSFGDQSPENIGNLYMSVDPNG